MTKKIDAAESMEKSKEFYSKGLATFRKNVCRYG